MTQPKLILAPAAAGKTEYCLAQVIATWRAAPLSQVWVVVPNRSQANAFRQRIAAKGGAMGARVGTFADLHKEILALAGSPLPVAPDAVTHRLALAAIDATAARGGLAHYQPIQRQPGLAHALARLVAELKRARVDPAAFQNALQGRGERLEELARLYIAYQDLLIQLNWADVEGLGWLAVQALEKNPTLLSAWSLVIADGFDILYPLQLETLQHVYSQVGAAILTLTGDPGMKREAYRRFKRSLAAVTRSLNPIVESLMPSTTRIAPLAHMERHLFESNAPITHPENALTFIEAQTPALEAREALRWLKARIMRHKVLPQHCAIIARDIAPYHPYLRQAGIEFGMPLRFGAGEPLLSNPAISAIFGVLELSLNGWNRRGLLDALRSPYLDRSQFGLASRDSFRFDHVAHWGQIVHGIEQWRDSFERLAAAPQPDEIALERDEEDAPTAAPQLPKGAQAKALWNALEKFVQRITPPPAGSVTAFVEWLEDLLSAEKGFAVVEQARSQPDTCARDENAVAELKEILRALVLGQQVVGERGEIAYRDFYADLRAAVEAGTSVTDDPRERWQSRLLCASLAEVRGISFRAVALLGLSEGVFPAPMDEDPFLPEQDRADLKAQGLAVETSLRSDQQSLFYEAVTRASEFLLLTRPYLADDGESWLPSPYWDSVRALYPLAEPLHVRPEEPRALTDCASQVELLTAAVRQRKLPGAFADFAETWDALRYSGRILRARLDADYRGPFDGELASLKDILAERYGASNLWSASALETFAQCGFRFLLGDACQLEAVETPAEGYDAAQLGMMLHAILEHVYRRAADPTDLDELVQILPPIAQELFDRAPAKYGFRPSPLWNQQRQELTAALFETVHLLNKEQAGFRPVQFEAFYGNPPLALDTSAGMILFRGRIDRVDRDEENNLRVIDYKTGGIGKYRNDTLGEGLHLQLVLYALGVEKILELGHVHDAFYWGILKGKPSPLRLSKFKFADEAGNEYSGIGAAATLVARHIGAHVNAIRNGIFTPLPAGNEACPDYCVAKTFCWRYMTVDH